MTDQLHDKLFDALNTLIHWPAFFVAPQSYDDWARIKSVMDTYTATKAQPVASDGKWYIGALNDGLFIIDVPPSPCGTDIPPDWGSPPSLVLNVVGLEERHAQAIVDAHNAAIAALQAQPGAQDTNKPFAYAYRTRSSGNTWMFSKESWTPAGYFCQDPVVEVRNLFDRYTTGGTRDEG